MQPAAAADKEEGSSRQRILDCAARLFRRQGYGATSLRDIAAGCGMKAGSLYYHFASKDEIVVEVLNTGVQRVNDAVKQAVARLPADAPAAAIIDVAIREHLRALHEADDYTSANVRIFGQVPEVVRAGHLAVRRTYEEYWSNLLSKAQKTGELRADANPQILLSLIISSLNATLEWLDPKRAPVEHVAATFSALVLRGIAK
jgi:AcrR family transcriptional regulator